MPVIPHSWNDVFRVCSTEAIVEATMRFPREEDELKRKQLACHFDVQDRIGVEEIVPDEKLTVTGRHIILLTLARDYDELGKSHAQIAAGGYYAAHWLRFRLYAAMNCPQMGSNNRWEDYVQKDLKHKVPVYWAKNRNIFNSLRRSYGPVAHLWLASLDERHDGLNLSRLKIPPVKVSNREEIKQARWKRVLGRAQSYFLAAQEAGLCQGDPGTLRLEDVWRLPDDVEAVPFSPIEKPDLMVPDFDPEWYLQEYTHPRA